MNGLLRIDVEDPEEPIETGDREVRLVSQAVDASDGADAALVLPEHTLVLRAEVEQCKITCPSANQNLREKQITKSTFLTN